MTTPLDKLGRPIVVGAYIVYGHAIDRSAALRIGRVLTIKWVDLRPWDDKSEARACRIRVQGVDDDWAPNGPELCKPGTLMYPERTIVVPSEQVPSAIRALLEST